MSGKYSTNILMNLHDIFLMIKQNKLNTVYESKCMYAWTNMYIQMYHKYRRYMICHLVALYALNI